MKEALIPIIAVGIGVIIGEFVQKGTGPDFDKGRWNSIWYGLGAALLGFVLMSQKQSYGLLLIAVGVGVAANGISDFAAYGVPKKT